MASAWRVIAEESNVSTLTVSENDMINISMSRSTRKESNCGGVVSGTKRETCRAPNTKISATAIAFMSTIVESEIDMKLVSLSTAR